MLLTKYRSKVFTLVLLSYILLTPLLSFQRNPDILHDAFFFSQGKAILDGMQIHKEIFSPYGPLIPWIFAMSISFFGNFLIIGRVLGLIVQLGICLLCFLLLRKRLSRNQALSVVALYVGLSPERTELQSERWSYGAGIWPTSITILLTLTILLAVTIVFDTELNKKYTKLILFVISLFIPLLLISRIQGILVTLAFLTLGILTLIHGSASSRSRMKVVLSSFTISTFVLMVLLAKHEVFWLTFQEMIIAPFTVTSQWMEGRWSSWVFSLLFSVISCVVSFSILQWSISMVSRFFNYTFIQFILMLSMTLVFYFAGNFSFPKQFNGNPFLWSLKVISSFPFWYLWTVFVLFTVVVIISTRKLIVRISDANALSDLSRDQNLRDALVISVGIASLSHLFWNYSYVYMIMPILMTISLDLLVLRLGIKPRFKSFEMLICTGLGVFFVISILGYSQDSVNNSDSILKGMSDTRPYVSEIDSLLSRVNAMKLSQSSQLQCDNPIFRFYDTSSYRVDRGNQVHPPEDLETYLNSLDLKTSQVLICGQGRFLSESKVQKLGWYVADEIIGSRDFLSIQLLKRVGGG
jgi:hypothetical protein